MASLRVAPLAPAASYAPRLLPRSSARRAQCGAPAAQPTHRRRAPRRAAGAGSVVAAAATSASTPHLQLATAKLPADINSAAFVEALYQWAATLTSSGRNLPFALPQRVDRLPNGFRMSLLRVTGGGVGSVADLAATVEPVAGAGDVLFVRFYEGEAAAELGLGGARDSPAEKRLETLLDGLPDVPQLMTTMPAAIKRSVMLSR